MDMKPERAKALKEMLTNPLFWLWALVFGGTGCISVLGNRERNAYDWGELLGHCELSLPLPLVCVD